MNIMRIYFYTFLVKYYDIIENLQEQNCVSEFYRYGSQGHTKS
jgi:hypothetical protein